MRSLWDLKAAGSAIFDGSAPRETVPNFCWELGMLAGGGPHRGPPPLSGGRWKPRRRSPSAPLTHPQQAGRPTISIGQLSRWGLGPTGPAVRWGPRRGPRTALPPRKAQSAKKFQRNLRRTRESTPSAVRWGCATPSSGFATLVRSVGRGGDLIQFSTGDPLKNSHWNPTQSVSKGKQKKGKT